MLSLVLVVLGILIIQTMSQRDIYDSEGERERKNYPYVYRRG